MFPFLNIRLETQWSEEKKKREKRQKNLLLVRSTMYCQHSIEFKFVSTLWERTRILEMGRKEISTNESKGKIYNGGKVKGKSNFILNKNNNTMAFIAFSFTRIRRDYKRAELKIQTSLFLPLCSSQYAFNLRKIKFSRKIKKKN